MRSLLPMLLIGLLATSCAEKMDDSKPAPDSQASSWLDGSQKDLKTFLASAQHRVVNIGPKRGANLLAVLYANAPKAVYATMITEIDDQNAFAEQIIVKLPKEAASRDSYVAAVKKFFSDRGYPEETVGVDAGDKRYLIIDPNPGGGVMTLSDTDDK